ncbi:MAG: hydroxymethylglutaryl-CoA synthase [Candidatus Micrarchaeota archaeon]|nr:hydroxymethylglutaryl-CoA synthase [Candidatus Micrarchaeota archaeon]MCX8154427.1 hydroxymethylglutaryl-CoA synthase [Candidatus Micrarchaeota archaeon]
MIGIIGYGTYIPKYRIRTETIAKIWGEDPDRIEQGLGIIEKSVPDYDEDSVSMAIQAAENAKSNATEWSNIGAVFFGSESHPYAVKSSASIVAEALGITPNLVAADMEFACRAGTAGMVAIYGMVKGELIGAGMAIGSDTAQGRPADALEYSAGAGAAAFLIGKSRKVIAEILATYSVTTDTTDFWRREGIKYPSHGGRFTGEPAYFKHIQMALDGILNKTGYKIGDFQHVVFHQPNSKFPKAVAKRYGVTDDQLKYGLLVPYIGNTYSAATMIGLANILDNAKRGDLILHVSFGSGAGSDAFIYEVKHPNPPKFTTSYYLERKEYIDYSNYLKKKRMILK